MISWGTPQSCDAEPGEFVYVLLLWLLLLLQDSGTREKWLAYDPNLVPAAHVKACKRLSTL